MNLRHSFATGRLLSAAVLCLSLLLGAGASLAAAPDVIYTNGKIVTLDAAGTVAQAIAVADGKVLTAGTADAIGKLAGKFTRIVNLKGKTVVPGLIDCHTHPGATIRMIENYVDGRYPGVPSVKQVLANIKARARKTPKGDWIFVAASSASQTKYAEKRLPTKAELDAAAPDNPVWFFNGTHGQVVNTMGLAKLGLKKDTTKLPHGGVAMTDENGEPTGVLFEGESDTPDFPKPEEFDRYYSKDIPGYWNKLGYTSMLAILPPPELAAVNRLASARVTPSIRYTTACWTSSNGEGLPDDLSKVHVVAGADPAWYRTGGIKAWVDGEPDARSGYLYEPYEGHMAGDFPGGEGLLVMTQEMADAFAEKASKAGIIPFLHATGDHATDIALNAYEKLAKSGNPGAIMRLEHFDCFLMKDGQMERVKALKDQGLKISVMPAWITVLTKGMHEETLGKERADTAFHLRSIIDAGIEPAAGSDTTGIYTVTLNPFLHIWACVTRESDMGVFLPEQAITVEEALKMWTLWAAKALGESDVKGSLAPGKYADMTVLSDDIFTMPPENIKNVKPLKTIVGGRVAYEGK